MLIAVLMGCSAKKTSEVSDAPNSLSNATRVEMKTFNTKQVINLLTKNIIDYYGLSEKYNTELKKKVFLDSPEGKELSVKFRKIYDETIAKDFYYIYDFDIKCTKYNIHTFRMVTEKYPAARPEKGYVTFHGCLLLSLPKAITLSGFTPTIERLSIPIKSETIALEIEENIEDFGLLFVFNLKSATQGHPILQLPDKIRGKTKQAYIINKKTGKIYSDVFK